MRGVHSFQNHELASRMRLGIWKESSKSRVDMIGCVTAIVGGCLLPCDT